MADFNNYNRGDDNRKLSLDEIEEQEQAEKRAAKKAKFNIFSKSGKDGKGVEKDEIPISDQPTLKNFFVLVGRKMNQLLSVNILMIVGNFPVVFLLLGMSGYLSNHLTTPTFAMFPQLYGVTFYNKSMATSALWTIFSRQSEVTVHTTADYVMFALAALLLVTLGLVRVGVTYIVKHMFMGDPIFMIHDFFYAIKTNLKQGLIYGILDTVIIGLIVYDIIFFNLNYGGGLMMEVMFFMSLCMAVLYFFMRHYMSLMLITFRLSIFKMLKNALAFTVVGLKRNIMVLLGTIACVMLEIFLMNLYFPLAVIVPFIILPSLLILMGVYGAYPKIKELMIDKYYERISTAQNQ